MYSRHRHLESERSCTRLRHLPLWPLRRGALTRAVLGGNRALLLAAGVLCWVLALAAPLSVLSMYLAHDAWEVRGLGLEMIALPARAYIGAVSVLAAACVLVLAMLSLLGGRTIRPPEPARMPGEFVLVVLSASWLVLPCWVWLALVHTRILAAADLPIGTTLIAALGHPATLLALAIAHAAALVRERAWFQRIERLHRRRYCRCGYRLGSRLIRCPECGALRSSMPA